jgi:hypothetical protein
MISLLDWHCIHFRHRKLRHRKWLSQMSRITCKDKDLTQVYLHSSTALTIVLHCQVPTNKDWEKVLVWGSQKASCSWWHLRKVVEGA